MENSAYKNPKKKWQKPDFYILDTNMINGGGPVTAFYEVHNGNQTKTHAKGNPAATNIVSPGFYDIMHS